MTAIDKKMPVVYVENRRVRLRIKKMEIGKSYEVEYKGAKLMFTRADKNLIEMDSPEPASLEALINGLVAQAADEKVKAVVIDSEDDEDNDADSDMPDVPAL
ncbi:MAG: hypothetical protein ABSC64_02380 [Candidatus Korobacteraceae bacterium]|jgi:hypothetical protein